MADDNSPKKSGLLDLRALMKDAGVASESARERLERADQDLRELDQMLERLGKVSASLHPTAEQLSDMTIDAARRVWGAGKAGEPFLVLVEQLSAVARHMAIAVCDLETYVQRAATFLQAAVDEAHHSSADLERVVPVLQAANRLPPPLPPEAEKATEKVTEKVTEKIVALELKLRSADEGESAERKPPSIFDVWPAEPPRRDRLKN